MKLSTPLQRNAKLIPATLTLVQALNMYLMDTVATWRNTGMLNLKNVCLFWTKIATSQMMALIAVNVLVDIHKSLNFMQNYKWQPNLFMENSFMTTLSTPNCAPILLMQLTKQQSILSRVSNTVLFMTKTKGNAKLQLKTTLQIKFHVLKITSTTLPLAITCANYKVPLIKTAPFFQMQLIANNAKLDTISAITDVVL